MRPVTVMTRAEASKGALELDEKGDLLAGRHAGDLLPKTLQGVVRRRFDLEVGLVGARLDAGANDYSIDKNSLRVAVLFRKYFPF